MQSRSQVRSHGNDPDCRNDNNDIARTRPLPSNPMTHTTLWNMTRKMVVASVPRKAMDEAEVQAEDGAFVDMIVELDVLC